MRILLVALCLIASAMTSAQTPMDAFEDPALEERYQHLLKSIRCMKCQNMSVAESPSDLARDIEIVVREQMQDGASNSEIMDFLIARYGAFISYRPPFQPSTWLLWFAPGLLIIAGGAVFIRVLRERMQQPLDEEEGI